LKAKSKAKAKPKRRAAAPKKKKKSKSKPKPKQLSLRGCEFLFEDVEEDDPDVRSAMKALRANDRELLRAAEPHVAQYCKETRPDIELRKPSDVWKHVRLGFEFAVSRRDDGDAEDGVYFSLGCNCDWEQEHGLQLVIRDGRAVTKVGPFDGHVTNADAYDDPKLVGVVYVSRS
jgi:hypothetical protein